MGEMAEEVAINGEEEEEGIEEEDENEASERSSMMTPDEAYLLELNLLMVIASLTLSNEEISEFDDMEKLSVRDQDFKTFVSKLQGNKRRDLDEVRKIPDRRGTRSQPKILDSRHGRKM